MNELVKIQSQTINNELVNAVNARNLHNALEVKTKFSDWIKRRLEEALAEEGVDFIVLKNENAENTLFQAKEFIITIDTAKEISMLERSQKGKEVRKYFIECEKQLRSQNEMKLPQTYKEALLELVKAEEEKERLMIENKKQEENIQIQNKIINGFELTNQARRNKQEMRTSFSKNVKTIAYYAKEEIQNVYRYIYSEFRKLHSFPYNQKIDIEFIAKNNDYLSEALEISLTLLNRVRGNI